MSLKKSSKACSQAKGCIFCDKKARMQQETGMQADTNTLEQLSLQAQTGPEW